MPLDNDAGAWSAIGDEWRMIDEPAGAERTDLRLSVTRESRRMRRMLLLEAALTIVAILVIIWSLTRAPRPYGVFFAIDTGAVLCIVWIFSIVTGRGLWRAAGASTADYLALARRLARRRLHTVHLALALLAAQVIVMIALPGVRIGSSDVVTMLASGGGALTWLVWAVFARRRALRDLRGLDAIEAEMDRMK